VGNSESSDLRGKLSRGVLTAVSIGSDLSLSGLEGYGSPSGEVWLLRSPFRGYVSFAKVN